MALLALSPPCAVLSLPSTNCIALLCIAMHMVHSTALHCTLVQ